MPGHPQLKEPAQRAVNFICQAQSPRGGWRYLPRAPQGDTEQSGWQLQALRMAQISGLQVPRETLARAALCLDECAGDEDGASYGYFGPNPTPTMTAFGLLSRLHLGWRPGYPGIRKGGDYLLKLPPKAEFKNMLYYYHATQVMHH